MRIGIGVTTCDRPEQLKLTEEAIRDYTPKYDKLFIYNDVERKGVAYAKNQCLKNLSDCDYVFLFDDDCRPKQKGWNEFFIESGKEHLLFMDDKIHLKVGSKLIYNKINKTHFCNILDTYKDCGGAFMFFTKSAIEKAGLMDETFGRYGFEHAEYSSRILGGHGMYPMLNRTSDFIFSEDYSNPKHKSVLTDEEKDYWIKNNWNKFLNFATK